MSRSRDKLPRVGNRFVTGPMQRRVNDQTGGRQHSKWITFRKLGVLSGVNIERPFVFVAIEGQAGENNVGQVLCIDFWNLNLRLQGLVNKLLLSLSDVEAVESTSG